MQHETADRHEHRSFHLGGRRRPSKDSRNTAWQSPGFRGYADYMQTPEFEQALDALTDLTREQPVTAFASPLIPEAFEGMNYFSQLLGTAG